MTFNLALPRLLAPWFFSHSDGVAHHGPLSRSAGVGYETNKAYRRDGYRTQQHSQEDYSFHFELDKDLCLYGVFDGHDGWRAAHFAQQRMPGQAVLRHDQCLLAYHIQMFTF